MSIVIFYLFHVWVVISFYMLLWNKFQHFWIVNNTQFFRQRQKLLLRHQNPLAQYKFYIASTFEAKQERERWEDRG